MSKDTVFSIRIDSDKLDHLRMRATAQKQTLSSYMKSIIDDAIFNDHRSTSAAEEAQQDIKLIKELLLKTAKASIATAVIVENRAEQEIKNKAREIASNAVENIK